MLVSFAQGEANIWYFGNHAGLDFNSGNPVALTNGQLITSEGCATISDTSGNLLFYTDGITVWNRNHAVMQNGAGLMGHDSTTQSATIVPLPGSATLYYVFTLDHQVNPNGFRYSVLDLSLDGGLGGVTSAKNVLVYTPSDEKISIVKHANNTDYWIVTHGWNNNSFFSYLLTSTGLSPAPVVSNVGTVVSGSYENVWGYMKISPDGSKLAIAHMPLNLELMDFNINTGVVSNARILLSNQPTYGVEFSPDSQLLYISVTYPSPYKIIQYNLNASNVVGSAQVLSHPTLVPTALQLGPDKKIYVAEFNTNKLAVINNPNNVGVGCNLQWDAIDLSGRTVKLGLPSFVSSFFDSSFTVDNLCLGSLTQFNANSTVPLNSVSWDFGDGSPLSSEMNPTHQYSVASDYTVTLTATSANGTQTKSKTITISDVPVLANSIPNQLLCGNTTLSYDLSQFTTILLGTQSANDFGVAYFSSATDASNHINVLPVNYNLVSGINMIYAKVYNLSNNDCYALTSFSISLFNTPIANIPQDVFICDDVANDGLATFDLQNVKTAVLGNQNSSTYNVSFHLTQNDADSNIGPLALSYQNISNPQTIYVRAENNQNTSCFATTSFQIGLYSRPIIANQPNNLYACDIGNDGTELFNLGQQTSVILGAQSTTDFEVTYHITQNDATTGNNALPNNYANAVTPQTIYVRVVNRLSNLCYDTASFQLILKEYPNLFMVDTYSICEGNPIVITVPSNYSDYSWTTGSLTSSSIITAAGNYSVTVIEDYGAIQCSTAKDFEVYNSNVATITDIEISDWTDEQNVIRVEVIGDGDYEFSLDGIIYQDSNIFSGLRSGQYTVYVRDKRGCGTVTDNLFLLMYPRYFTPNGDGVNDTWQIKFSMTEPQMELQIFDRYGKLITQFKGLDFGWDGTLNGKLLFADDYWFVVKRQDGEELKGHFSLLR